MAKRFQVVAFGSGGASVVYSSVRSLKRAEKLAAKAAREEHEALCAREREIEEDGGSADLRKYARSFTAQRATGTRGVRSFAKAIAATEIRVHRGGRG